jgi:hypothetical protein
MRFLLNELPYIFLFLIDGFEAFPFKKLRTLIFAGTILISTYYFYIRNFYFKQAAYPVLAHIRDDPEATNVLLHVSTY